jgi:hypothetical protein
MLAAGHRTINQVTLFWPPEMIQINAVYKHKLTGVYGRTSVWPQDPVKLREAIRDLNCAEGFCFDVNVWFWVPQAEFETAWELVKEIPR